MDVFGLLEVVLASHDLATNEVNSLYLEQQLLLVSLSSSILHSVVHMVGNGRSCVSWYATILVPET